jgi:2-oxoglutarate ferredoxin oxidoreductase subunit beta
MFGLNSDDWSLEIPTRYFCLEEYASNEARWCPGCGDHAVLAAVQRICRDEQLPPEKTVAVSGIGCSSRFPHYLATYGYHGLHGRALPCAEGVRSRRPDLHVVVVTGDGDCCSIGAGHWLHALRYNPKMVVLLFDNNIYGLTKKQTSPTTHVGFSTNTHPKGAFLPPLNPTATALGFTNASFIANTVDWNPVHLHATILAGYKHRGLAFIRIFQRCPQYTSAVYEEAQQDPSRILLLTHEHGIQVGADIERMYPQRIVHDPRDLTGAQALARRDDVLPIGLFYQDESHPCYDDWSTRGLDMTPAEKLHAIEQELDACAV